MLRTLLVLLLASVALCAAETAGESATPTPPATPAGLEAYTTAAGALTSMRVSFVQEKQLKLLKEPLTTPGTIELDRTAKALRWEFTGQAVLVLAGGKLRRWGADGKAEDAVGDASNQAFIAQMQALLSGDFSALGELFTITLRPGEPVLELKAKTPELARFIANAELRFTADLSAPARFAFTSGNGDATVYVFAAAERGVAIAPARFQGP